MTQLFLMAGMAASHRMTGFGSRGLHAAGVALALLLADAAVASAFPVLDSPAQDAVPQGVEPPGSEPQDLVQQLRASNGLSAPAGGGWSITPRISLQTGLTDNVLQQHSPRRFDLGTFVSPGIGIAGDTPRFNGSFDFAPVLSLYARTGSLNQLTEQMNGLGTVTVVPDLAYVDLRAVSGARSQLGGFGGIATLGSATDSTLSIASGSLAGFGTDTLGLTRENAVQTASFGVSPYLVHRFGDWGSGRVGYSFDVTRSDTLSGFAAAPFPVGGTDGQSLATHEEYAHFETGDILPRLQDGIDIDLVQRQSRTDGGFPLASGVPAAAGISGHSTRVLFSDRITYALTHAIAVFASGGHEDISYSGGTVAPVHDLTWSLGAVVTPNADSRLTVSYGHLNGFNSLSVDGHYALTARTTLTASYGSSLGTQLETVQTTLNQASVGKLGTLVNSATNAPSFGTLNLLAVQDGVFRTTSLALGSQTAFDRDIISLNFLMSDQSSASIGAQTRLHATTVGGTWLHQMRPDMIFSAGLSLSWQNPTGPGSFGPGRNTSVVAGVGWQQQISETLTAGIRYSLLTRQSEVTRYTVFQNLLIFGITKAF